MGHYDTLRKTSETFCSRRLIFGYRNEELCLLLYPRGFEPSKGSWSLMGGFVQEKESSDDAAKRILKVTTGLQDIFMEQVETFSDPGRDPEARVISISYYALIRIDEHDELRVREHGERGRLQPLPDPRLRRRPVQLLLRAAALTPIGRCA